jgi:hypothetical protein
LLVSLQAKGLWADIAFAVAFHFSDYFGLNNHAQLLFPGFQTNYFQGGLVLNVFYSLDIVTGGTGLICFFV